LEAWNPTHEHARGVQRDKGMAPQAYAPLSISLYKVSSKSVTKLELRLYQIFHFISDSDVKN
jgi:hypothetical protein